jgi:hypothetical protein
MYYTSHHKTPDHMISTAAGHYVKTGTLDTGEEKDIIHR